MAILTEIPLQNVINQALTVNLNNQIVNIVIRGISVNNKELQNNTASYEPKDELINGILVPKSDIFMTCDISLGNTPIIYNVFCNNACYLNFAPSALKGYLFFYVDNWETKNSDKIIYTNFGAGNNTHLYYADYDALALDFNNYVNNNKFALLKRFVYNG